MKKTKLRKRILLLTLIPLLIIAIGIGCLWIYSSTYTIPEQAASIENTTGLVQAHGRSLYTADGKAIRLKGINAGQILVQEGWMGPFALEPLKNKDGSYVKDGDNNIQYPEFTEEEFRTALAANPNLAGHNVEELLQYYWKCFFTEEDFRISRKSWA